MNKPKCLRQAVEAIDLAIRRLERGLVGDDEQKVLRSVRAQLAGHLDLAVRQALAERDARERAAVEVQRQARPAAAKPAVLPVQPIVGDARLAKEQRTGETNER